jgi:hypothetical protein
VGRQLREFSRRQYGNDGSKASRRSRDAIRINAAQVSAITLVAYRCELAYHQFVVRVKVMCHRFQSPADPWRYYRRKSRLLHPNDAVEKPHSERVVQREVGWVETK